MGNPIEDYLQGLRAAGPTMDVPTAAAAIGISRATLYSAIQTGQAPVRTIRVLGRVKVLTESVVALPITVDRVWGDVG